MCAQTQYAKMPSYTLTYFNFKGRGELMRLIFAAAGQKFTDERVEMQDWPAIKPSAHIISLAFPCSRIRYSLVPIALCADVALQLLSVS